MSQFVAMPVPDFSILVPDLEGDAIHVLRRDLCQFFYAFLDFRADQARAGDDAALACGAFRGLRRACAQIPPRCRPGRCSGQRP